MKFLSEVRDVEIVKHLDKDLKNKFRWNWFQQTDHNKDTIGTWCKKTDHPGECFCVCCNKLIRYESDGLNALIKHSRTAHHIGSKASVAGTLNLFSYCSEKNATANDKPLDIISRKSRTETIICSFIAENNLPYSMGPKLIEFAQVLGRDPKAIASTSMNRTTVAYKTKYGLSKTLKARLIETLKYNKFSLNVDESTSNASQSILTILVQYYCTEINEVVINHLATINLKVCNAQSIYTAIVNVIEGNEIPWGNLISLLLDSCNVMRGKKNGVEVQIREKKAPHLLNIDGDTCHTMNNCAKKFTSCFNHYIEALCDDMYFDLQSNDKRMLLFQICEILEIKCLAPLQRPNHRWLYVLPVLERISFLWDALLLFYFSWIKEDEKRLFASDVDEVYKNRSFTAANISRIVEIQLGLKRKPLTAEGKNRKERIIKSMFVMKQKTLLHMAIYKIVLSTFNEYIKYFQNKKPLIHELHVQMYSVIKKFLSYFMKPEVITSCGNSFKSFLNLDVSCTKNHLPDKLLFVGTEASKLITTYTTKSAAVCETRAILKEAYVCCGKYMIQKLPLRNSILIRLSCLSPNVREKTSTLISFLKLAEDARTVLTDKERGELDGEIRQYQTDDNITQSMAFSISYDGQETIKTPRRIDNYWADVSEISNLGKKKYIVLSKLTKSLLSCFHGPVVESAFSFMENIITPSRTSLNAESLDATQTIKYYLLAKKSSTFEEFSVTDPITQPLDICLQNNMINSWKHYESSLKLEHTVSKQKETNLPDVQLSEVSDVQAPGPSTGSDVSNFPRTKNKEKSLLPSQNIKRKTESQVTPSQNKKQRSGQFKINKYFKA